MSQRFQALQSIRERPKKQDISTDSKSPVRGFGAYVFNRSVMQKMLPSAIFKNVCDAMEGIEPIKHEYADTIAVAMKEWAISLGATHFTHWFHPLTGLSAEKHDAFIEWTSADQVIEKFSGKQLIQGEPDASSFPSGGLRSTFEARGYTGWDPTSPAFIWKAGHGTTLCIPSVYFSWTGDVLDSKIPLLRSIRRLNDAVLCLLSLTGIPATHINCTLGLEQEYFVIDRRLYSIRPDLMLAGRTVQGAAPSKGQELQDHYFGSVKERILSFMHHFETEALKLGIPVKTRHNEVAPAQHEVAPVVEKGSVALDHNIQLMELMRKIAVQHDLAVLLHEKPFNDLNGSGKHCNWSLVTDSGINLLDPTDTPENNLHFLILLTAIVHAVHKHAALLRASIGSAGNDFRLGGHEAPPAIISIYLGTELELLLENIEKKGVHASSQIREKYDLGLSVIPPLSKDNTDRNRTSPFAFTGNKFEFRAVGSSQNPAIPVTVLNVIVAMSLEEILAEIGNNQTRTRDELVQAVLPVLRKKIKASKAIRFHGDNYTESWVKEAKKRGLPNLKSSVDAFAAFIAPDTVKAFQGILHKHELESRYVIALETYCSHVNIEANLSIELFRTQILPAALKQEHLFAGVIKEHPKLAKEYSKLVEKGITLVESLEQVRSKAFSLQDPVKRAKKYGEKVIVAMDSLRQVADQLETLTDDALWPLSQISGAFVFSMKKIALYGGTFDPIHFGHINLALEIYEKKGLDEVWVIPARVSPHKLQSPPIDIFKRFAMCSLALDDLAAFKVLDVEAKREAPSYTIDTLNDILPRYPHDQFFLILGDESVPGFFNWKDPKEIVKKVELLVGSRQGDDPPALSGDPTICEAVCHGWTPVRKMGISATDIRNRIKEKLYISHLVPHKVVDYIYENSLY